MVGLKEAVGPSLMVISQAKGAGVVDPGSVVVFKLVESFALGFATSLFTDYVAKPIVDRKAERDRRRALERVADVVADSLLPLLEHEVPEDQARLVLQQTELSLQQTPLTEELLAQNNYSVDSVISAVTAGREPDAEIMASDLGGLYENALGVAVNRALDIAPHLPQWERLSWDRNFRLLEQIDEGVKDVRTLLEEQRSKPTRRAEAFEKHYRDFIRRSNVHVRLFGIRVPEVLEFDIDTAFVDLGLGPPRPLEPVAEDVEEVDLRTLAAAREQLRGLEDRLQGFVGQPVGKVLAKCRRLVIVGPPGAGKTTLMQHLVCRAAETGLHELEESLPHDLLPFLFRVRSLDLDRLPGPEDFVRHCAPNLAVGCPDGLIYDRLSEGRALIIVDGLDECEEANREQVLNWIADLTAAYEDCTFVVTSRPAGYRGGDLAVKEYAEAELQPLGTEQMATFVQRWCEAAEKAVGAPDTTGEPGRRASDLLGGIRRTASVRFMATNPLLLSVLCVVHRYRHEGIPERRAQLLDECISVLLHEWRKGQGLPDSLVGDLDASQKRALVRPLAWQMMEDGVAEVPRGVVEDAFRQMLPDLDQPVERAAELVDHIRDQSGLLVEQRPGVFAFAHLVFQECLAAEHAVAGGDFDALLRHGEDDEWTEVIPLAAGLAAGGSETLVRALLQAETLHLAGRCVAAAVQVPSELRDAVVSQLLSDIRKSHHSWNTLIEIGDTAVLRQCMDLTLSSDIDAAVVVRSAVTAAAARDDAAVVPFLRPALREGPQLASDSDTRAPDGVYVVALLTEFIAASLHRDAHELPKKRDASIGRPSAAGLAMFAAAPVDIILPSAWPAELSSACTVGRIASVMAHCDAAQLLPELRCLVTEPRTTPEQRLLLWCALVEALQPADFQMALSALRELPADIFPLLRLFVVQRLARRWHDELADDQRARLDELISDAQSDVEAHIDRFAESIGAGQEDERASCEQPTRGCGIGEDGKTAEGDP